MTIDNDVVRNALAVADRYDRLGRAALIGAALFEALALGAALYVADFADRTHLLMLILAVLVYGSLALGLIVIDARQRASHARLLRALELAEPKAPS